VTTTIFASAGKGMPPQLHSTRRVLLAIYGPEVNLRLLKYTLHLCQRIQAGLEVLWNVNLPDQFFQDLSKAGIVYQVTRNKTPWKEDAVIKYANSHPAIAVVVVDSLGTAMEQWNQLECPLVVAKGLDEQ